jgi:hypothetical protein
VLLSPLSDPIEASIPRRRSARDCWLTVAPPASLGCDPPADPSLVCQSTMLCTPAQGRCAAREPEESRRRAHASGLAHLYLDTAPQSMRCVRAPIHHPPRRHLSYARCPGWKDGRMPVAARRLDALASLESGQDTTRRLAGRAKRWTTA